MTPALTLLCFTIADARYALALDRVVEVVPRLLLTPLPGAPASVTGAFSYRGTPLPAVDLRARLGHPPRPPERNDHFIVARSARRTLALVVDRVETLRDASPEDLAATPFPDPSVAGIVPLPDGLLLVYDLDAALSLDEERAVDAGLETLS